VFDSGFSSNFIFALANDVKILIVIFSCNLSFFSGDYHDQSKDINDRLLRALKTMYGKRETVDTDMKILCNSICTLNNWARPETLSECGELFIRLAPLVYDIVNAS
jgi:hypothetical protein